MDSEERGREKEKAGTRRKVLIIVLAVVLIVEIAALGGILYVHMQPVGSASEITCNGSTVPREELKTSVTAGREAQESVRLQMEEQNKKDKLIVIDAGHQEKQNSEKEPVGPGASETKAKVSSGTSGRYTGVPEYQVTLEVSLKLEQILNERGYEVIMVRTTNDVNISNSERAQIANDNHADAFVRIHCDGSENPSSNGAMTICMTPNNPYCSELYTDSQRLSTEILDHLCQETGAARNKVWETDTMSGINWCKVPVTIVEMGYMSNEAEDRKLVTSEYQDQLAKGIADGIEVYLSTKE